MVDGVIIREINDNIVVCNNEMELFSISGIGGEILKQIENNQSVLNISKNLINLYDEAGEIILEDMKSFLIKLLHNKLIEEIHHE